MNVGQFVVRVGHKPGPSKYCMRPPWCLLRSNWDGDHLHSSFHVLSYQSLLLPRFPFHSSVHFSSPTWLFFFILLTSFCVSFVVSFRRWGGRWVGASQGADSANSGEAYGQVQSQGWGNTAAVFCGWRGEICHSRILETKVQWHVTQTCIAEVECILVWHTVSHVQVIIRTTITVKQSLAIPFLTLRLPPQQSLLCWWCALIYSM